jgi:hypothetical protein
MLTIFNPMKLRLFMSCMSDEISGGSVILPYDVDSLFSDELQQLQISGTGIVKNLTITDGNMIQFSVADNDNDSTNELQGLGEVLAIDSNAGGHNIVNIKSISIGCSLPGNCKLPLFQTVTKYSFLPFNT